MPHTATTSSTQRRPCRICTASGETMCHKSMQSRTTRKRCRARFPPNGLTILKNNGRASAEGMGSKKHLIKAKAKAHLMKKQNIGSGKFSCSEKQWYTDQDSQAHHFGKVFPKWKQRRIGRARQVPQAFYHHWNSKLLVHKIDSPKNQSNTKKPKIWHGSTRQAFPQKFSAEIFWSQNITKKSSRDWLGSFLQSPLLNIPWY